jgi:hypothetical protein
MTDTLPRVVVPYADFLEHREQRRTMAAEVARQNVRRTIDTEAVPVSRPIPSASEQPIAIPHVSEETNRSDSQPPVQNAERIT